MIRDGDGKVAMSLSGSFPHSFQERRWEDERKVFQEELWGILGKAVGRGLTLRSSWIVGTWARWCNLNLVLKPGIEGGVKS